MNKEMFFNMNLDSPDIAEFLMTVSNQDPPIAHVRQELGYFVIIFIWAKCVSQIE